MDSHPCALYRLHDHDGALLYIGISNDPRRRWKEHRKEMLWWSEVTRKDIEWLANRVDAGREERCAIRREKPRYNKGTINSDGSALPPGVPPQPYGARDAYQYRELRPMHRQAWFLWRLLLQDGLEAEKERAAEAAAIVSACS